VAPAEVEEEDEEEEFGGDRGRREQKGTPEGPGGIEEFANKTATANTQTAKTKVQNAILEILRRKTLVFLRGIDAEMVSE
jgi:hypothetical protein